MPEQVTNYDLQLKMQEIQQSHELKMEELRAQREKDAAQQARDARSATFTFWASLVASILAGVSAIAGSLTPILLRNYHIETVQKVDEGAIHAQKAVKAAQTAVKVTEEETAKLNEKVDANNLQWKAYNTKKDEDMNKAAEALSKVEKFDFNSKPQ